MKISFIVIPAKAGILFFLSFISSLFAANDSCFYHRDIFIRESTEASLDQLIRSVLRKNSADKPFTVFSLNHLYLLEGAKLFVREPSEIDAERIVLKPKSGIYSLGHPIQIRTAHFDAVHYDGQAALLTAGQKIESMGRIDSTFPPGLDGVPGAPGADGLHGKVGILPTVRGDGSTAEKGGDGTDGKDAGSQIIQVKHLRGGYFLAAGSNGGSGGEGGGGGKGGSGLQDLSDRDYRSDLSMKDDPRIKGFLNGGVGGDGGPGGNGGNGGSGAAVQIYFEKKSDDTDEMLLIVNHGGERGKGGVPGKGGDAGEAGVVYSQAKGGRVFGEPGHRGPNGREYGREGRQGMNGSPPVVEYRKYDEE